jgi:hypothetical protein
VSGGVAVVYCHPGTVEGLFHESMMQLLLHDARTNQRVTRDGEVASLGSGPRISSARNTLANLVLAHPKRPDWMWMVDADMTFAPDTLDRLVKAATDHQALIMGGLCFGGGRGGALFPTLYRLTEPDEDGKVVHHIEDYPADSVVKVDATGAACILVHRAALVKIRDAFKTMDTPKGKIANPAPWFMETFHNGREFGEDWTFCMRAAQVGIPVYVHTGIKVGHVKPHLLDEVAWHEFLTKREELGSKEAVVDAFRKRALGGNTVTVQG